MNYLSINKKISPALKVVHLSTSDSIGGAAIAAYRLMLAQREAGIEANMLVLHKESNDPFVESLLSLSKLNRVKASFNKLAEIALGGMATHSCKGFKPFVLSIPLFGFNVLKHPLCQVADVIHVHYSNQGFLSLASLKHLAKANKKVVFTLHDLWHVVAICHHSSYPPSTSFEVETPYTSSLFARCMARYIFEQKRNIYLKLKPAFVGCSRWISTLAQISRITPSNAYIDAVANIPNIVDFVPHNKYEARTQFGFPSGSTLILFGAMNASDPRKGYKQLIESLQCLANYYPFGSTPPHVVIFGKANHRAFSPEKFPMPVHFMGYINHPQTLAMLYSACDIYLTTSLEENLPNTIIEAQLCNCPTVAFNVGGISEIIRHSSEGILVEKGNCLAIAKALNSIVTKKHFIAYDELNTRAIKRFNKTDIVDSYNKAYQYLLSQ